MVMFYQRPVSAYITYLALLRAHQDITVHCVFSSHSEKQRVQQLAPFVSQDPVSSWDVEAEREQGTAILVTAVQLLATGVELTRASYVVLMEPAHTLKTEEQCLARVHRQGQGATTVLRKLICPANVSERVILCRQQAKDSATDGMGQLRDALRDFLGGVHE